MREQDEAELRVALAEGLITRDEVDGLRADAVRLGRLPLDLLVERGRLSGETLSSLRRRVTDQVVAPSDETLTMSPDAGRTRDPTSVAFPIPGWDRYQPRGFLGEGGMGRVFLAYDPRLQRNVALKFVRGDDVELARRFLSEARAQARVDHERVCKVYEVGEVDGKAYIAMQYIDGRPLSALASELTVEQKAMMLRDVAGGIHAAHRVGLIHRDIKPSNIMVERTEDGRLKPYVLDFGLARDWNERGANIGMVLGTPRYMSPEQARGEGARLDRRADVYSLGATLYQVLTGRYPVSGSNSLEVLTNIATEEPRPPRALEPDIPADLEAIVLKCLEKDRSARYESARAFAEDLDRFLGGDPVQARSGGRWYRLRKRLRKHARVVSVTAAALALALLALGWAAMARREAALREHLVRRFTERVEGVEASARYSDLSPLHDVREDRRAIRARMEAIEAHIREVGERALGPGHYALGRGYLALGDEARAREYLESAWRHGSREPRAAYALALVIGHLYQEQLLDAERIPSRELRETRKREIAQRYRDPALAYLRQSEGAEVPSTDYVAALLAFYEDRLDEALTRLDAIGGRLPWFYEAPLLRGDILLARATRRWNQGEREAALADFEAGRRAYAAAAAIGESVPAIHRAMAVLEHDAMVMAIYGKGDATPAFTRGIEAVSRALAVDPGYYDAWVEKARLHRRLAELRANTEGDVDEPLRESVAAATRAIELAPTRPEAVLDLGRSHWLAARHRQGRGQDPRDELRRAVELFERVPPEVRGYGFHADLGLVFKVWADYEEQIGLDSSSNRGKAIDAYLAAIRINEHLPDAWINLGIAYFKRASHPRAADPDGDLERARAALERARRLNPEHVVPWFYEGQVYQHLARRRAGRGGDARPDLATAVELLRKGIGLNPKLAQLHNALGLVLLDQAREEWDRGGDPFPLIDRALATFEQAIAVAPQQGYGHLNASEANAQRATYLRALGRDPDPSLRASVAAARQALTRMPDHGDPWSNLGMAHALQAASELERGRDPRQHLARSSEALQNALARNPNDAQAWLYRGETLGIQARWVARQGRATGEDFERAAEAFRKAIGLAPERLDYRTPAGHFLREWAAWSKQAGVDPRPPLERGLTLADEVLARRPDWPDGRLLRASVLVLLADVTEEPEERQRRRRQALEDFDAALTANPNHEPGWKVQRGLIAASR